MDWLEKSQKNTKELLFIYYDLLDLSEAFEVTGNMKVASRLKFHANKIDEVRESIVEVEQEVVSGNLKNAQQSTANMLNAVLALSTKEIK